jgi:hypothetical protein
MSDDEATFCVMLLTADQVEREYAESFKRFRSQFPLELDTTLCARLRNTPSPIPEAFRRKLGLPEGFTFPEAVQSWEATQGRPTNATPIEFQ